ncbi:hypothetical protein GQ457_12G002480 [Hibiscus cannabinus]
MTEEGKELKKKKDSEKIESSLRDNKEEDREDDNSLKKPGKIKRVKGVVVHTEDLWKAKRCLVGTMNIVCSVRSLELRLQEWGLEEINVKRLDGKSYLLAFDNDGMEDRFHHCETQEQITLVNEMMGEAVVSKTLEKVIGQVEVPAKVLEISNNFQESRVPSSDGLSMRAREDLRAKGLVARTSLFDQISKKKERKFGSLSTIQDIFLSEAEKRKQDRIKKHLKKKEIEETISELEGRSITDSDIEARRDIL